MTWACQRCKTEYDYNQIVCMSCFNEQIKMGNLELSKTEFDNPRIKIDEKEYRQLKKIVIAAKKLFDECSYEDKTSVSLTKEWKDLEQAIKEQEFCCQNGNLDEEHDCLNKPYCGAV